MFEFLNTTDLIVLAIAYIYVVVIFVLSEFVLDLSPSISRKFLHIMVGNCVFLMPFFVNPYNALFITVPFTIVTFLLTEYSPIKIENSVTSSGHALGLLYYAATWTALIILFPFNNLVIVALAIAAMCYGDGFAAVIGEKYGKHEYNISGDKKTIEGSTAMFLACVISSCAIIGFYNLLVYFKFLTFAYIPFDLLVIAIIALIATVVEAITPKGLDNVTACFTTAILYVAYILVFNGISILPVH